MVWKIKPHDEMDEEEQKKWKRTVKQSYLRKKTYYLTPKASKGIMVGDKLGQKKIDLDKWISKKEKEGFDIDETPEGITLEKEGYKSRRVIFIGKKSVDFELKKKKAEKDLGEVV